MMPKFAKKSHLTSLISILVFSGMLVSYAGAQQRYKAHRYNRDSEANLQSTQSAVNNAIIRIHSLNKNHDFGIVFGPITGSGNGLNGKGKVVTLQDESYDQEPCWQVERGTATARGWRPRIRGTTVTAAAEGSTIIFERDSTYERVFFPAQATSSSVCVWVGNKSQDAIQLSPGHYVQVEWKLDNKVTNADIKPILGSEFEQRVEQTLELDAVQQLPEVEKPDQSSAS